MCGRYALYAPHSDIATRYRFQANWVGTDQGRYNITPGTAIALLAMRECDGERAPVLMPAHWGFRPAWADSKAPAPINARAETVATSPYFREAFRTRRALVPANGWFEWRQTEAGGKQPWYVTHADGELLMLAGLWEPTDDGAATSAIITRPAHATLEHIHPRMPVALAPTSWDAWMDPEQTDRDRIREAARPLPADALVAYPVSHRVNRPANDDPTLIEPEKERGPDGH